MSQIARLSLTKQEEEAISSLLSQLAASYPSAEDPEFIRRASLLCHRLPERVRGFLNDFKYKEDGAGVALISGNPVDDVKVGPTPLVPMSREDSERTRAEQMLLVLYASLLGDVFGWSTQQGGYLVHDVFPAKEHEHDQLGFGSREVLTWHVEDAFHPFRGDYLGLFCLRNTNQVPTTLASAADVQLSDDLIKILFEPRYTLRPDESHLSKNRLVASLPDVTAERLDAAYKQMERMNREPPKISVLFGDPNAPYLRLDPYFMDPLEDDPDAQKALDILIQKLDAVIFDLVLEAGDCVFLDNYRTVHGRRSFVAKFDGTDRWLKRVNVTRDLRRSRELRPDALTRIIL